jgi:hypothetical protein
LVQWNLNGDFGLANTSGEIERLEGFGRDLGTVEVLVEMPRVGKDESNPCNAECGRG